jgi:hypothetical protein
MKCNVGKTEQMVRIGIGLAILLFGLSSRRWWAIIGLAPIITGVTRYCPANDLLGISN